ncbi:MAG TPA: hypothetical protein VF941_11570 [Clostridia bacterium]
MNLLDLVFFPEQLYSGFNNKKLTLFIGVLIVGISDTFVSVWQRLILSPVKNPLQLIMGHMGMLLALSAVIGIIDVLIFSYPVYEGLRIFKNRQAHDEDSSEKSVASLVKVMKVYILANILCIPFNAMILFLIGVFGSRSNNTDYALILELIQFIIQIIFLGIITRGLSVLYKFKGISIMILLFIVYLYADLMSQAINSGLDKLISNLLK